MKLKLTLLATVAMTVLSQGAVSLQFSNANNALTNFMNGAGTSANSALVWGVLVDTAGDGFDGGSTLSPYDEGFSLAATSTPLSLTVSNGSATDDRLYIAAGFLSANTTIDSAGGSVNRALTMGNMSYAAGVAAGQSYAIIWFDTTTRPTVTSEGLKYGIYTPPSTNFTSGGYTGAANVLPPDPGTYSTLPAVFAGADTVKTMGYSLGVAVPETSTSLLGALGALALLRRRRN
jgi:MYXO-CTERM domain-containing protein